jgi:thiol-disulfide isomerase/thioredoxin
MSTTTTTSTAVDLTDADFDAKMNLASNKNIKKRTVILFYSPQCGHCVRFKPEYEALAERVFKGEMGDDVTIAKVDSSVNRDLMNRIHDPKFAAEREFNVMGVPTVVGYYNGKYYSTYAPGETEEERKNFRTVKDLMDYISGLGTAPIVYKEL